MTIQQLVENKSSLDYQQICISLIEIFAANEKVNWDSVLPAQQQQSFFGGETLRLIADHPILSKQSDIRPIALKRGSISQMLFFYLTLKDDSLSKKNIQEVTKKFITGGDANRYIIWFFGNTKNTELKVVLSAKEGKKIVLKTLPFAASQPYYKTYNFILNEVSQKVNQLFVEPTDLWKALWKAFDISIINRNFYDEIKAAFTSLIAQLNKTNNPFKTDEDRVQFAIRLIGRIIFCWFLKRKDVLHDAAISADAVEKHQLKNYYHDLLEPLFFDVLNTPEKERKAGLPKLIAHYPFLNGGLFEAQETDFKYHLLLDIENSWFYNLFSKTLERYNFTVDENSSSNAEIAIDPEMLGRIFENLLAEQNPETGDSARKATGSFYTPREIVDYMVEQSITEFLKTSLENYTTQKTEIKENLFGIVPNQQLSLPKVEKLKLHSNWQQDVEDFVHMQILPDALAKYEEIISNELNKVKVLDPACGSGAFPIGILQKIVALKQQLHPKTKNYNLKLDTIQNSIYGVDIQPMAVELSRLRCWLSLVVDEDPKDIKALPNLDFKFVCADTLMEVGKIKQLNIGNSLEKIEELKTLRAEFFIASGKRKKELEKKFKQIQTSLNNNFLEWDGKSKLVENLASWKPFDNHKTEWFDAFWMFGIQDGFDIVIGNPPYVQLQNLTISKEKSDYLKSIYFSAQYKVDLYHLFIEQGIKVGSSNGVICFITPNTFLKNKFNNKLREYVIKNTRIIKLIRFFVSVFNQASVDNAIFVFQKDNRKVFENSIQIFDVINESFFDSLIKPKIISQQAITETAYSFDVDSNAEYSELLLKIGSHKKIQDFGRAYFGIQTFDRKKFVSTEKINENYKPVVDGTNVLKYFLIHPNEWIEFIPSSIKSGGNSEVYLKDRILVRQIGKYPEAAYCVPEIYTLNTIYNIFLNENSSVLLKYVLSIINSKVIKFYWLNKFYDSKETFPKIKKAPLESIPIPEISLLKQQSFIRIVDFILLMNENKKTIQPSGSNNLITNTLEDIADGMVFELFFEEEMKLKNIDIIKLVEAELTKLKGSSINENIVQFYNAVSSPDSEIRNRILMFPIASPTILKPILQG